MPFRRAPNCATGPILRVPNPDRSTLSPGVTLALRSFGQASKIGRPKTKRATMRTHTVLLAMLACIGTSITAADGQQFPDNPHFLTHAITSLAIEGLTGDDYGNLYTTGRAPA